MAKTYQVPFVRINLMVIAMVLVVAIVVYGLYKLL